MTRLLRRRPSPAMGVALLALFVSLGGVSYGVATGSIDSREIRNNAVRSIDLRNNQARSKDIRNNDVRGRDIRANTITGGDVDESTLDEVPVAAAVSGVRFVQNQAAPVNTNTPSQVEVSCAAEEKAIGGGAAWIIPTFQDGNVPTAQEAPITASMPVPATASIDDATGWRAAGRNLTGSSRALRVYAVCVKRSPAP